MNRYLIHRAAELIQASELLDSRPWQPADGAAIAEFPWHQAGRRQATRAALLYDDANLYFRFDCDDRHSSAQVTALNGPVHTDSCVEAFFTPWPTEPLGYFNLEINCCGTFKLGFGPGRPDRRHVWPADAAGIIVQASLPGPTKTESPDDERWQVAAAVPYEVLSSLSGRPVCPKPGDAWHGNFYRCGGRVEPQYACWNPVASPKPDYHRPECFGEWSFS